MHGTILTCTLLHAYDFFTTSSQQGYTQGSSQQIETAMAQMRLVIFDLIDHSVGEGQLRKAVACVYAMQRAASAYSEAARYNAFMREIKQKYQSHEVFGMLKAEHAGPLNSEHGHTDMTDQEVSAYFETIKPEPTAAAAAAAAAGGSASQQQAAAVTSMSMADDDLDDLA
jgi:Ku C terminal domain like